MSAVSFNVKRVTFVYLHFMLLFDNILPIIQESVTKTIMVIVILIITITAGLLGKRCDNEFYGMTTVIGTKHLMKIQ